MLQEYKPFSKIRHDWEPSALAWYRNEVVHQFDISLVQKALLPFVLNLDNGGEIIEIAAGANNSIYYPSEFDMKRITAVDASKSAVTLNPSGRKIHADIREPLDFPDGKFSLGVCVFGMRYLENQENVILEMLRVLKKGYWSIFIDFVDGDNRAVRDFDVKQLVEYFNLLFPTKEIQTKRLYVGCRTQAPMDLFAIRNL